VFKLFGEGKHESFHKLLLEKLSPHLSSHAFDYWLHFGESTFGSKAQGLYFTGGSRHALKLVQWISGTLGIRADIRRLCEAQTLAEQREIWTKRVRKVLLSQFLSYFVVGTEQFLWKALGVPGEQRAMIEEDFKHMLDHQNNPAKADAAGEKSGEGKPGAVGPLKSGQAIWNYAVQTLDPVANETLMGEDNHYYLVCLLGKYTRKCHPDYLQPKSHQAIAAQRFRRPSHPHRRAPRGFRPHATRGSHHRRPHGQHGLVPS